MSTNRSRAKFNKAHNGREYRIEIFQKIYPPYYDDGINFFPKYRKGFKNPIKRIMGYQVRMYRTWKHNRKTQWKEMK